METAIDRLLNPSEAAQFLGVTVAALAIMRTRRKGPGYVKFGRRVKYSHAEIARYVSAHSVNHDHPADA